MEKLQLLAQIQAFTGIGIGLMIGLGAAGDAGERLNLGESCKLFHFDTLS